MFELDQHVELGQLIACGFSADVERPFLVETRTPTRRGMVQPLGEVRRAGRSACGPAPPSSRRIPNGRTRTRLRTFSTSSAYSIALASDRSPVEAPSTVAGGTRLPTFRMTNRSSRIAWRPAGPARRGCPSRLQDERDRRIGRDKAAESRDHRDQPARLAHQRAGEPPAAHPITGFDRRPSHRRATTATTAAQLGSNPMDHAIHSCSRLSHRGRSTMPTGAATGEVAPHADSVSTIAAVLPSWSTCSAVVVANRCMVRATIPVQPVWWLAPRPAPLSPWKYS